jgi:CRISPR/Cas system-associated protein Csm6
VTCHLDGAEMRHAGKRAVEENQSSVIDERSRCWGKAAALNEVIIFPTSSSTCRLMSSSMSQRFIKEKIRISTELRTETGYSSRVLNVGTASAVTQLEQ